MRRGLSQRRACALMDVARSALTYQSILALEDAPVIEALKQLAADRIQHRDQQGPDIRMKHSSRYMWGHRQQCYVYLASSCCGAVVYRGMRFLFQL